MTFPIEIYFLLNHPPPPQKSQKCSQFSVPQIEYPLGGSSKSSHVFFLFHGTISVASDCTIVPSGDHGMVASE